MRPGAFEPLGTPRREISCLLGEGTSRTGKVVARHR
jgi:hypothetical protein